MRHVLLSVALLLGGTAVFSQERQEPKEEMMHQGRGPRRAVALARQELGRRPAGRYGMYFNGVVLISSILSFQTARFQVGNDLPYPLFLPTYTATVWYHKRLPADLQGDLQSALKEAESFALGEYTLALAQGNDLAPERRRELARKVARLTGLSPEYVERVNLRPVIRPFTKELLRAERKTVGRLDSRAGT